MRDIGRKYQITEYCHRFLRDYIREGDICIDATAGNGHDTEFLCRMTGKTGKVYAFDIQKCAVESTRLRLEEAGLAGRAVLICDGHEKMGEYVERERRGRAAERAVEKAGTDDCAGAEKIAVVMFNLGYLPGGDHMRSTKADTTLEAVRQGLELLKTGGVMSLCIYSGKETGYEERDALLAMLKELDARKWLVIVNSYYNRKNDPPLPVFIIRLK